MVDLGLIKFLENERVKIISDFENTLGNPSFDYGTFIESSLQEQGFDFEVGIGDIISSWFITGFFLNNGKKV